MSNPARVSAIGLLVVIGCLGASLPAQTPHPIPVRPRLHLTLDFITIGVAGMPGEAHFSWTCTAPVISAEFTYECWDGVNPPVYEVVPIELVPPGTMSGTFSISVDLGNIYEGMLVCTTPNNPIVISNPVYF